MLNTFKVSYWNQFGAAIDMLVNAVAMYPEERWENSRFFYISYHVTVFLDYYLTNPPESFMAPLPFTFAEEGNQPEGPIDDLIPDRSYHKEELLTWLEACREKCRALITSLTEKSVEDKWIEDNGGMDFPVPEILLYNMRHVQHHAAQLNMLLRQETGNAPDWVSRAR
jgi:hypothetical protein